MRVLCDQNVPQKYLNALTDAGVTATTVESVLEYDATDAEIATYAETNGWVVFTNDDDFYVDGGDHGLLFYSQVEDPSPGTVVEAVERIGAATRARVKSSKLSLTGGRKAPSGATNEASAPDRRETTPFPRAPTQSGP